MIIVNGNRPTYHKSHVGSTSDIPGCKIASKFVGTSKSVRKILNFRNIPGGQVLIKFLNNKSHMEEYSLSDTTDERVLNNAN